MGQLIWIFIFYLLFLNSQYDSSFENRFLFFFFFLAEVNFAVCYLALKRLRSGRLKYLILIVIQF